MMKKLSCGLLALSMAFNGAPALLGSTALTSNITLGAVSVSASTPLTNSAHVTANWVVDEEFVLSDYTAAGDITWTLAKASESSLIDGTVTDFTPDVAGVYTLTAAWKNSEVNETATLTITVAGKVAASGTVALNAGNTDANAPFLAALVASTPNTLTFLPSDTNLYDTVTATITDATGDWAITTGGSTFLYDGVSYVVTMSEVKDTTNKYSLTTGSPLDTSTGDNTGSNFTVTATTLPKADGNVKVSVTDGLTSGTTYSVKIAPSDTDLTPLTDSIVATASSGEVSFADVGYYAGTTEYTATVSSSNVTKETFYCFDVDYDADSGITGTSYDSLTEIQADASSTCVIYVVTKTTTVETSLTSAASEAITNDNAVTITIADFGTAKTDEKVTYGYTVYTEPEEEYVAPEVDSDEDTKEEEVTGGEVEVPAGVVVADADVSTEAVSTALSDVTSELSSNSNYTIASTTPLASFKLSNFPGGTISIPVTLTTTSYSYAMVAQYSDAGVLIKVHGPFRVTNGSFNLTGLTQFSNFYVYGASYTGTTSSGNSYTSATYHDSGSVRVNGSYITELRNVLVGELVNLSKITTVNGQEVTGWYYDSAMTREITNPSQFVVTSSVISDGLYARTSGTTVVPDSYVDGSTNAGTGVTTAPETTYQPSVVPSTVAKLLGKLF